MIAEKACIADAGVYEADAAVCEADTEALLAAEAEAGVREADTEALLAAAAAVRLRLHDEADASSSALAAAAQNTPAAAEEARQVAPSSSQLCVCVRARPLLEEERPQLGQRIPGTTSSSYAQHDYEAIVADACQRRVHVLSETRGLGGAAPHHRTGQRRGNSVWPARHRRAPDGLWPAAGAPRRPASWLPATWQPQVPAAATPAGIRRNPTHFARP